MDLNINIITTILKYEADEYKKNYDKAILEKKESERSLEENFKPNTDYYKKQKQEIKTAFEKKIAELRATAAERALPDLEDLREQEKDRISDFDEKLIAKLQVLKDVPLTEQELTAIAEKIDAKNDYYASRMLLNIAEKNGIQFFDRTLESSYDTKMTVLDQLTSQFNAIITGYPGDKWDGGKINHLYLSDDVLERAKELYSGKSSLVSADQAADKAFWSIKSQETQIEKGLTISNTLRNLKGNAKNLLLCMLAEDTELSDLSINLSGHADEINGFKAGKAKEYREATNIIKNLAKMKDDSMIEETLKNNSQNSFLGSLFKEEATKNNYFAKFTGNIDASASVEQAC